MKEKTKNKSKTLRKLLTPSRDFCTGTYGSKHRFEDYTYWGSDHPKCDFCGYEDKTRVLKGYDNEDEEIN